MCSICISDQARIESVSLGFTFTFIELFVNRNEIVSFKMPLPAYCSYVCMYVGVSMCLQRQVQFVTSKETLELVVKA